VAFCVPHANAIMGVLYGSDYAAAGPLLALFLALNALVRLAGGGAHDAALYVLGRQQWVVVSRWGSLGVLALGDVLLIPRFGAAGALLAVGLAQLAAELFLLALARRALARPYPVPFMLRVLAALTPPLIVTIVWRPSNFLGLVLAGVVYALLFVICLRVVRPLDGEDEGLLREVSAPLRAVLQPFVTPKRAAVEDEAISTVAP
jgi:O-antigen/teichoic acid export membrane protein